MNSNIKKIAVICAMSDEAENIVERLRLDETGFLSSGGPIFFGIVFGKEIFKEDCVSSIFCVLLKA